ncbi:MAG TPA: PAS domain-containing protein [Sphingomicrobium sp.]|nr:PAS domain-containing protein [Sphingomicrobium sp.]
MHGRSSAEEYLQIAVETAPSTHRCAAALDELPVPIYVTDADGVITYSNHACAEFAGREPQPGQDRWCVTWRLYTTSGELLPHDRYPMAEAIRERRAIRDSIAIAMRPDGSRVAFKAYPTPIHDENGDLLGAINMLIDISDEQADVLADQAARCHRLARATHDRECAVMLETMAAEYEETAAALHSSGAGAK